MTSLRTLPTAHMGSAPSGFLSAACLLLAFVPALLLADTTSVNWTDPAKPGRLRVSIGQGDLRIRGTDTKATVTAKANTKAAAPAKPREDGLRVLGDTSGGFSLTEKDNVAELTLSRESWHDGGADFAIEVPRSTVLDIQIGWSGDVRIGDVEGDVSIRNTNGSIVLEGARGGVSIETISGDIDVSFAALPADKPVAVTSLNGNVKILTPNDAKANVRFRTHNGTILTDFPETALLTKTEEHGHTGWGAYAGTHIKVATQIATEAAREVGRTAREIADEVRAAVREQQRAHEEAKKELDEARREAEDDMKTDATGSREKRLKIVRPPRPPRPPSIPAIAGGKVVSGPLNGGGIDLQATTMNGDITLKKR